MLAPKSRFPRLITLLFLGVLIAALSVRSLPPSAAMRAARAAPPHGTPVGSEPPWPVPGSASTPPGPWGIGTGGGIRYVISSTGGRGESRLNPATTQYESSGLTTSTESSWPHPGLIARGGITMSGSRASPPPCRAVVTSAGSGTSRHVPTSDWTRMRLPAGTSTNQPSGDTSTMRVTRTVIDPAGIGVGSGIDVGDGVNITVAAATGEGLAVGVGVGVGAAVSVAAPTADTEASSDAATAPPRTLTRTFICLLTGGAGNRQTGAVPRGRGLTGGPSLWLMLALPSNGTRFAIRWLPQLPSSHTNHRVQLFRSLFLYAVQPTPPGQ